MKSLFSNKVQFKYKNFFFKKINKIYSAFKRAKLDLQAKMQVYNEDIKMQIREKYFKNIHIKTFE